MSEKQFQIIHLGNPYEFVVKDNTTNKTYGPFEGDEKSMSDLLNEQQATNSALRTENNHLIDVIKEYAKKYEEQQATIRKLQDLCGQSDGENAKLRIENKRLQEEIKLLKPTNIEQYEQIQKLQEENEQLRQQQQRLYNYFRDYLENEMSGNAFSEMWDFVKEDEKWKNE